MKFERGDKCLLILFFVTLLCVGFVIGITVGGTETVYLFNQTCSGCIRCGVCNCP